MTQTPTPMTQTPTTDPKDRITDIAIRLEDLIAELDVLYDDMHHERTRNETELARDRARLVSSDHSAAAKKTPVKA